MRIEGDEFLAGCLGGCVDGGVGGADRRGSAGRSLARRGVGVVDEDLDGGGGGVDVREM